MEKARLETFAFGWPHDTAKGHGADPRKVHELVQRGITASLPVLHLDGESRLLLPTRSRLER